jgi:hypothetical protein
MRRHATTGGRHPRPESPHTRSVHRDGRRQPVAATVLLDVDHLLAEMDARGITGRDLARETGIMTHEKLV